MSLECIQDEESRLFLTSIGSWEGPISWTELFWAYQGGAGKILVPGGGAIITVTLKYPAIIVILPGTFSCALNVGFDLPATALTMKVKATDGNYTHEGPWYTSYSAQHWEGPGAYGDLPKDWNIEGTTLQLLLSNPGTDELKAYIDSANFLEDYTPEPPHPKKIDYLPIMGMG